MCAAVNYCRPTKRDYIRYVDAIVEMYPAEQPVSKSILCCICMNILMYVREIRLTFVNVFNWMLRFKQSRRTVKQSSS
jgi:hypothetical protein